MDWFLLFRVWRNAAGPSPLPTASNLGVVKFLLFILNLRTVSITKFDIIFQVLEVFCHISVEYQEIIRLH